MTPAAGESAVARTVVVGLARTQRPGAHRVLARERARAVEHIDAREAPREIRRRRHTARVAVRPRARQRHIDDLRALQRVTLFPYTTLFRSRRVNRERVRSAATFQVERR